MQRGTLRNFYELLSSMRFAISLLTLLAIASVIGTVLKQNEPWNAYLNQFGPFWFPIFAKLELYAVYNASWFLAILLFLVVSTTACIVRQTGPMLREMKSYREHAREESLTQFAHHTALTLNQPAEQARGQVEHYLQDQGFRLRVNPREDGVLIAAKQGSWNRIGYFLAHGAIVLICLGGLMDGNLPLKLQMWLGGKEPAAGNQAMNAYPDKNRLGVDNWSYRANVFIPEGMSADTGLLNINDGILLQPLPFSISLQKFHLEHYPSGMPKRFASDIVITDKASGKSFSQTIEVNKPFEYQGITLYQASFEDGGSRLKLQARNLAAGQYTRPATIEAAVGESVSLNHPQFSYTLELTGFRPFNVENFSERTDEGALARVDKHLGSGAKGSDSKDLRNVGPSFEFKLRDNAGQAVEFRNYMAPVELDGRRFMLSGMRDAPSKPFRFLRIPVDERDSPETWFAVRSRMLDPSQQGEIARRFAQTILQGEKADAALRDRLQESALRSLQLFTRNGYDGMEEFIQKNIPEAERDKAAARFADILRGLTWETWMLVRERAGLPRVDLTEERAAFVSDALNATSEVFHYGAPVWIDLADFQEVRATVLQATRSPGKPWVYLGSLLLTLGVFAMLYIRERRLFVLLKDNGQAHIALSSNRKSLDVEESFAEHVAQLQQRIAAPQPPSVP